MQSVKYLVSQDVTITDPFMKKALVQLFKGIIFGVNQEITEDEIIWETHAKQAHRIVKFIGGKNIQTLQIILTYEDELPSHVFIGWQRYRVDKYIPDPIRCFRCQRYGIYNHNVGQSKMCVPYAPKITRQKNVRKKSNNIKNRKQSAQTAMVSTQPIIWDAENMN